MLIKIKNKTVRINTLTQKLEENEGKNQQFDDYKTRCEEFDGIQNKLEQEAHEWKEQVTNKDNEINSLNLKITELEGQENYSEYTSHETVEEPIDYPENPTDNPTKKKPKKKLKFRK